MTVIPLIHSKPVLSTVKFKEFLFDLLLVFMMSGKIACVTGASRGIGAEICVQLANEGYIVVGIARSTDKIDELKEKITNEDGKIVSRKCDVTNEEEIVDCFQWIKQEYGRLDVFVNNAGIMMTNFLIDESSENFRKMFEVNVIASCICIREAANVMKEKSERGHIIVINSVLGHRVPDIPYPIKPSFGIYPATKYALTGMCQTLRQELSFSKHPIRVTSISPGMVDSDMLSAMNSQLVSMLPKLSVEDVAEAVIYAVKTPARVRVDEIILNPMLC